jgi:hypothetical protein
VVHPQPANQEFDVDPQPFPLRVFEVTYIDGSLEQFSAHVYDTTSGHCIFIDRIRVNDQTERLYYRQTIAAGQWRKVREITGSQQSAGTH